MVVYQGLDRTRFDTAAADPETTAFVADLEVRLATLPPAQEVGIQAVREAARSGQSFFGPVIHSDIAGDRVIETPAGGLSLRVFTPPVVNGVYLHFHGGGWAQGASDLQDPRLERAARECEVAVISVDYRLAPEHPYPAPPDDAETAAVWLAAHARSEFGTDRLVIGGESAGAHLAAVALLRLRDKHGLAGAYCGANLLYGAYDLTMTPSARAWGNRYLILSGPYIDWSLDMFVAREKRTDPDVSPLYADLSVLPPALFSVGTVDPLLDDSLFMHARWLAAGNEAELAVYPGLPHAFPLMPLKASEEANGRCHQFIKKAIGGQA
jgi:acetyl esterase/lipase